MDLMLPGISGQEVTERIKADSEKPFIPVILVTAKNDQRAKVTALDAGADDFLGKPYDPGELAARVRALARRSRDMVGVMVCCGNLSLSLARREISIGEQRIDLAPREVSLLAHLMGQCGRAVSRDALIDAMYGFDQEVGSNPIEVHVHRIRKRLLDAGASVRIENRRGIGYRLVPTSA